MTAGVLQHLSPLRFVLQHDFTQEANREHPVIEQFVGDVGNWGADDFTPAVAGPHYLVEYGC